MGAGQGELAALVLPALRSPPRDPPVAGDPRCEQ